MELMDWGTAGESVAFGEVSKEEAEADADVFVLIAPQNVVGNTIMTRLGEMTAAAEANGAAMVLVNPKLTDIPSHSGAAPLAHTAGCARCPAAPHGAHS